MGSLTGALTFPAFGCRVRAKSRVDYQNTSEVALVRRTQAGDEAAFREIVERYQSKVFSMIHGFCVSATTLKTLPSRCLRRFTSLRGFDFRSSLITWIYKITVNECFDYLRKRKVRKLVYESDLSEDEVRRVDNSEPGMAARSHRRQPGPPRLCLETPERGIRRGRILLMFKEVEGYSVEELAEKTGMNENTIKVKLFRARQKLVKAAQR